MRTARWLPLALLACGAAPALADKPSPPPGNPLVRSNVAFAGELFRAVRETPGNLFLSPYSVSLALAMTREGAAGNTATQMDSTLQLPPGGVGDGFARLAESLRPGKVRRGRDEEVPAYALRIANAPWAQQGYPIRPAFLERLKSGYAAELQTVDFGKPDAARARINGWVEEQTNRKIKDLIPAGMPPPLTRLILVNAVYFKAAWDEKFSEQLTKDEPFAAEGAEVKVRMMHDTDHRAYGETALAQVVEIPYLGHEASMVVVLPKKRDGLAEVETKENIDTWTGMLQGRAKVALSLPKFTFTSSFDLSDALKAMGMPLAFDASKADFSGMSEAERFVLAAVLHKAFVAVDEEGTEAAAATAVLMVGSAMPRPETIVEFKADHPFLFFLRHRATGAVLFIGRVADPSSD